MKQASSIHTVLIPWLLLLKQYDVNIYRSMYILTLNEVKLKSPVMAAIGD